MSILQQEEKIELLKSFPQVELSYETIIHNKVYSSNYSIIIPDGQKCFVWFTNFKNQNVCILMEIKHSENEHVKDNKQIQSLKIVPCCFKSDLSYGTIFYGTCFLPGGGGGGKFFSVEDILYYKGKSCNKNGFLEKLTTIQNIFQREIRQVAYSPSHMVFGLPIISDSISKIKERALCIKYKIQYIQFRDMNKSMGNQCFNLPYNEFSEVIKRNEEIPPKFMEESQKSVSKHLQNRSSTKSYNEIKRETIFIVKPDIQNDIYNLYSDNGEFFEVAYIPDYKTSVFMNTLFRKIKENGNLDLLEESDDEEEFENDQLDKFVYLDRYHKMVCTFNNKFKKWVPTRLYKKASTKEIYI